MPRPDTRLIMIIAMLRLERFHPVSIGHLAVNYLVDDNIILVIDYA